MKIIAMSSACLWGTELPEIIHFAGLAGFGGLEVWTEQLGPGQKAAFVRRLAEDRGLSLFAHAASWDLNLCSHNKALRNTSMEETKRSIDLACELGAENITVHPGRMGSPVFDQAFYLESMTESLAEICRYASKTGMAVSLELMEKIHREFVTSPDVMNRLLNAVSPLPCAVTLDSAHLDSAEMFFEYFSALPQTDKIHLSNRRGNKCHTPVFNGDIDMTGILELLGAKNLPVVIEGAGSSREELAWTLGYIHSLLKQKVA
jgi:sugar phosphate isomerase/epimerase